MLIIDKIRAFANKFGIGSGLAVAPTSTQIRRISSDGDCTSFCELKGRVRFFVSRTRTIIIICTRTHYSAHQICNHCITKCIPSRHTRDRGFSLSRFFFVGGSETNEESDGVCVARQQVKALEWWETVILCPVCVDTVNFNLAYRAATMRHRGTRKVWLHAQLTSNTEQQYKYQQVLPDVVCAMLSLEEDDI